jgi:anti-sigma factor RsiW
MKIPDLILEQYRLGELPRAEADRVSRLLCEDPALQARHAALEQSDEAIGRDYPPGWLARRVRARLPAPPARGAVRWRVPLGVAAAAMLALVAIPLWTGRSRDAVAPAVAGDRIKGLLPALTVYRRTASGTETLADGSVARAGDLLRVGYTGAGRAYGVILSIDGRGGVTLHLPARGELAAPLTSGPVTLLDQAYELDDAPGWERFYFVTGETPFAVAPVMQAARKVAERGAPRAPAALPLGRELTQSTFSLQKEVRP